MSNYHRKGYMKVSKGYGECIDEESLVYQAWLVCRNVYKTYYATYTCMCQVRVICICFSPIQKQSLSETLSGVKSIT